jgi:hypothetical protein
LAILISFDIDGTLEVGDPPGGITLDLVRRAQELGCVIGSCSDWPISAQQALWERHNIKADFVSAKHKLDDVKLRFEAERYIHIGDRDLDKQFAERAGFHFFWADEAVDGAWLDVMFE